MLQREAEEKPYCSNSLSESSFCILRVENVRRILKCFIFKVPYNHGKWASEEHEAERLSGQFTVLLLIGCRLKRGTCPACHQAGTPDCPSSSGEDLEGSARRLSCTDWRDQGREWWAGSDPSGTGKPC